MCLFYTIIWINYIYISPPSEASLPLLPYSSPQVHHRAPNGAPCANSNFPPAIYFAHGSLHVSAQVSRFTPPSPCLLVPTCLFSRSASHSTIAIKGMTGSEIGMFYTRIIDVLSTYLSPTYKGYYIYKSNLDQRMLTGITKWFISELQCWHLSLCSSVWIILCDRLWLCRSALRSKPR